MLKDEELARLMQQVPGMILINRILKGFESRCVVLDDYYGSLLAVRHLIQNGHRDIGYICSDREISDASDRLSGYKQALNEQKIDVNSINIAYGPPNEKGGEQAMMTMLERNCKLTAIACYNDSMAAGAMSVLYENDIKIPTDVSVIGFDDVPIANYLHPKLTTIRYPILSMSQQAAELALALSKGEPEPTNTTNMFVPTLVKRYSVKTLN